MSARTRWPVIGLAAALGGMAVACADRTPVERLPTAEETIVAIGRRLGGSLSPRELSRLVGRGDRILAALTRREREALGRSWVRFRVDRPVVIEVAAPARAVPFWLADQGFSPTGQTLTGPDGDFSVYRKAF